MEKEHASAGVILAEKDLHCLARILQGYRYRDGDMFGCCRYCPYHEECDKDAEKGKTYFTGTVTGKLQEITGVYLGTNTHNLEEKLLVNSFQATSKCENTQ